MPTYVYRPQHPEADEFGHVEKEKALEWDYYNSPDNRSSLSGPMVITDVMPETRHMCDGKYYTSKAEFRKVTKQNGCIEYGNETKHLLKPRAPTMPSREQRKKDIKTAIQQLKAKG